MKNNFAEEYAKEQEIRQQYNAAEGAHDEKAMDMSREAYRAFCKQISEKGDAYAKIYGWYADAKNRKNNYIDLSDTIWDNQVADLIASLRDCGIEKFTFSSTWSSAVETAWLFTQNGCKLEGLVEINGRNTDFYGNEFEKAHGYLFSIS